MRTLITALILIAINMAINAKPQCQGFNNYDDKVTIVFTDDNAGEQYTVSDVKLIPTWKGQECQATSVKATEKNGVAIVTIVFPHITQFSNLIVSLRINRKNVKFKVCQ